MWNAEWELRVRCDGLTPLEVKGLASTSFWEDDKQCLQDVEKILKFFGAGSGGNASCKRLLKWLSKNHPSRAGATPYWASPGFSLGRHLLLAERQAMQGTKPENSISCRCFAETYLMGAGCIHNKTPNFKPQLASATLCATCSKCIRCGKLLV